jgi:hypothetical protein
MQNFEPPSTKVSKRLTMTHNKALTTWLTTKTHIASIKKHRKDRLNQTSENFEKTNQKFFEQHKFFDDFKANNGKFFFSPKR